MWGLSILGIGYVTGRISLIIKRTKEGGVIIITGKEKQTKPTELKRIASFDVNHLTLEAGLYLSRRDEVGGAVLCSYDVRITAPNKEPYVNPNALHTIEHLLATYYRNTEIAKDVVYVGPMGCLTGMYIILNGDRSPEEMHGLIQEGFEFILNYGEEDPIPGATAIECGNYMLHDLSLAKFYARKYLAALADRDKTTISY